MTRPRVLFVGWSLIGSSFLLAVSGCGDVPTFGPGGNSGGGSAVGGTGLMAGSGSDLDLTGGSGNATGGKGQVAPPAVCGNGDLEDGEFCDDGNEEDGDGCSSDCLTVDDDYLCVEPGKVCARVVTCGNGILEGAEVCDDGNEKSGDGCAKACDKIEAGFTCTKPGRACVPLPECGNGTRERGEQCDDGQAPKDDDGCSAECQLEDGFFCPPGEACVALSCGDGNRTPDEACDDGNSGDGDGCDSDCQVESGWRCSSTGCSAICGDGEMVGSEQCDDSDKDSGDGCSSACKKEPFYVCPGIPGACTSTIVCGDGDLDPGEVCDPAIPGSESCYNTCDGYDTGLIDPAVCGNGVIEFGEDCDGDTTGNNGCVGCVLQDGFACPKANYCFRVPECGDGFLQAGEKCDPGAMSTMGCVNCQVQTDYFCSGQPSNCVASVCGDGFAAPDEQCDDGPGTLGSPGTPIGGDGCSATCTVESGWVCPPGIDCITDCGDGVLKGTEECEESSAACTNCKLNPGYKCDGAGKNCEATACGNGTPPTPGNPTAHIDAAEPGEGCDDGNLIAGDGCGPTCQLEPPITRVEYPTGVFTPEVTLTCGDGFKTPNEDCDDGNNTSGDGCSSTCLEEPGWGCSDVLTRPTTVTMAVTYRDFRANSSLVGGGHPHFENVNQNDKGIAGPPCTTANVDTCGRLDSEGKPVLDSTEADPTITGGAQAADLYASWYRDTPLVSGIDIAVVKDSLPLTQIGGTNSDVYEFSSAALFPLNGIGLGNTCGTEITGGCCGGVCAGRNYNFTTELRYFFQYQGGEELTFRGDDDVWVFINGRLAVDVGGVHCAQAGRVVLGDDGIGDDGILNPTEDSNCSVHGATYSGSTCSNPGDPPACAQSTTEATNNTDERFGLTKGGVYEIVLFHAERHTDASNFRLTLSGFLAPRSNCNTDCGDGIKAGTELCDTGAGMPATGYGVCLNNCTFEFCGDGAETGTEECDNGLNADLYDDGTLINGCAPGCVLPGECGDDDIQSSFGEECDNGGANSDTEYSGCTTTCELGPYCGDGILQSSDEECDLDQPGEKFVTYNDGTNDCGFDCQLAPYCGDGERNGAEICDDGAANGTAGSNCNTNCEFDPFCGDGLKTMDEACDFGSFAFDGEPADAPYGGCTTACELGPYCGDASRQSSFGEECDDGDANVDGEYDACTTSCLRGPHCGDAIPQTMFGEACDNGFNDDVYAYPGVTDACGKGCKDVPFCGDGDIQSAYELCDDGSNNSDTAYDGCTTTCDWGPYCGDGVKNGQEKCDDGVDNVAYSPDGKGCSYDCKADVPYCGDGVRNGPELCDLGTANNTGDYGGCNADCTRAPYCGDNKIQASFGEKCDQGPNGDLGCTTTCQLRDGIK